MFAALLAALLCVAVARNAAAQDGGFFSGKTITVVVGYSAGGGYDQYARMLARHLGRHIPGNPTIVVRNMPGAASLTAVRYLSTTAPKDGTVITVFDPDCSRVAHVAGQVQCEFLRLPMAWQHVARRQHLLFLARNRHCELG